MTNTTTVAKPASTKQLDLIAKLMGEKMFDDAATETMNEFYADYQSSSKIASKFISFMFRLPRKQEVADPFKPEAGMYRVGDDLFRIKISRSSGQWYAEVAVKPIPGSGRKSLKWDYVGKRVKLSTAEKLSDAEAGKFSGYCVRCNAELTVPESIERGMGPVCANKV